MAVERFVGDAAEWDAFVQADAAGTFCHLSGWWPIIEDVFGHRCLPLCIRDGTGALTGILPLVHVNSRLFGRYLISMPFLNAGGPLGAPAARSALAVAAEREGRERRVSLVELRNRDAAPEHGRVTGRKITVHLPLPDGPEGVWRRFPSKLRSQIRRAEREGFRVEFGRDHVDAFYEVFARNMRALGTPVLPRAVFRRIAATFGDTAEFVAVYDGTTVVAGGCGFYWNGAFELTWASSRRDYSRRAPNMLMYWSLIARAAAAGHHTFDFGRCTPGGGTHRFKRQWGGHDVPLPWTQWSASGVPAPPSPDQPVFRIASACWRRLPLPVANRLGPLIATQLP
ncbi:MAG TPA: FemAB family XrtA/PEP-CTERM system-associated protein [Gemmatimonadaceae bacterium]|nr:FemAB family XrtA/PEP-CTERM system-associated protein [Gemmatimonadaceae bacterium]